MCWYFNTRQLSWESWTIQHEKSTFNFPCTDMRIPTLPPGGQVNSCHCQLCPDPGSWSEVYVKGPDKQKEREKVCPFRHLYITETRKEARNNLEYPYFSYSSFSRGEGGGCIRDVKRKKETTGVPALVPGFYVHPSTQVAVMPLRHWAWKACTETRMTLLWCYAGTSILYRDGEKDGERDGERRGRRKRWRGSFK